MSRQLIGSYLTIQDIFFNYWENIINVLSLLEDFFHKTTSVIILVIGEWTSGKSSGSEPVIRRFESYLPSHSQKLTPICSKKIGVFFIFIYYIYEI